MQTTANLWEVLCRDLETQRSQTSKDKHHAAAQNFKESAMQVFRESSPRLCDALEISGDVCQASGFLDDAVKDFQGSLDRNLKLGSLSSAARVAAKLALLMDHLGEEAGAIRHYTQALELYETSHDHSQDSLLASNLAGLEKRSGDFPASERHYKKALDAAVRTRGEIHPEVALICNNLGVAYTEFGDWVKAENLHMRALGIREQLYGAMHQDVAQSLANLAVVYHSSANYAKARGYYQAALDTFLAFRKPDDPEVVQLKAAIAKIQGGAA